MFLEVDDHPVFAANGGQPFDAAKPTVIFLHGAGATHTKWLLQSRWFAWHGWSVLAIDLPGHGRSEGDPLPTIAEMVAWVGRLMDAAGIKTATLIGHSMGAIIAMEAAVTLSDRIDQIAILGITPTMPVTQRLLDAAKDDPDLAYRMLTDWSHGRAAKMGRNQVPGMWMTGTYMAVLAQNKTGALYVDLMACNDWNTGAEVAEKISCPTLIIIGQQDAMTPAKGGRKLAKLIKNNQLTELEDCSHEMMAEAPDAVLDAMIAGFGAA